jgi:hypothetical protein
VVISLGIIVKLYKKLQIKIFIFLFEHISILLLIDPGSRIEKGLRIPIFLLNLIYSISDHILSYRKKLNSNKLQPLSYKLKEFIKPQLKSLMFISNMVLLIRYPSKKNITQSYSHYYIHYSVLLIGLFFYVKCLAIINRLVTLLFIISLGGLMLYYEHITDYRMTDQTPDMIGTIRIIYILLFIFVLYLLFTPSIAGKIKVIGIPFVLLSFFLHSQEERSFLLFYFLGSLWYLSLQDDYNWILILSISSYLIMHGSFGLDISLRAGNKSLGVNPDEFPLFTGFLFGVHKLSWYILSGCGLLGCESFDRLVEPLCLRSVQAILVYVYGFYFTSPYVIPIFIWAMSQCLILFISHSLGMLIYSPLRPGNHQQHRPQVDILVEINKLQ